MENKFFFKNGKIKEAHFAHFEKTNCFYFENDKIAGINSEVDRYIKKVFIKQFIDRFPQIKTDYPIDKRTWVDLYYPVNNVVIDFIGINSSAKEITKKYKQITQKYKYIRIVITDVKYIYNTTSLSFQEKHILYKDNFLYVIDKETKNLFLIYKYINDNYSLRKKCLSVIDLDLETFIHEKNLYNWNKPDIKTEDIITSIQNKTFFEKIIELINHKKLSEEDIICNEISSYNYLQIIQGKEYPRTIQSLRRLSEKLDVEIEFLLPKEEIDKKYCQKCGKRKKDAQAVCIECARKKNKKCQICGKEFIPQKDYYVICYNCYIQRMLSPINNEDPPF